MFAHVLSNGIRWHGQPALAAAAQPRLTLGVYLQPMLTAGLAGDHPGGTIERRSRRPQLVATLFVADRGQLEGALAVANADLPLGTGIPLRGRTAPRSPGRTASRWRPSRATRSGSW